MNAATRSAGATMFTGGRLLSVRRGSGVLGQEQAAGGTEGQREEEYFIFHNMVCCCLFFVDPCIDHEATLHPASLREH